MPFSPLNAKVFGATTLPLCEHEPRSGRPARLADRFHGYATLIVGKRPAGSKNPGLRLREDCAFSPDHCDKPRRTITHEDWNGIA